MRWLIYASDETGRDEIYLLRFPDASGRRFPLAGRARPVSTTGGTRPRWRRDGRELFYLDRDDNLVAVEMREAGNDDLEVGMERVLFNINGADVHYDVAPDGQRFLMARPAVARNSQSITMLADWAHAR